MSLSWVKMECPYCAGRIPVSSDRCPECRAIVPYEAGDKARKRFFIIVGVIVVGLLFGLLGLIASILLVFIS